MNKLVNYIMNNGGMTYNPRTGEMPSKGFVCAIQENEHIIPTATTESDLYHYLFLHCESFLNDENAHFGVWYNTEDGQTYLDTSYVFDTREEAEAFAIANNQLAYFDLETFTEYRL